jgi:hypothetical protein
MAVTVKASSLSFNAKVEGGKVLIQTEAGYLTPAEAGVTIDYSSDGGGGGGGTPTLDYNAGTHAVSYTPGGLPLTDTWTLDGVVRVKTFTYVNGRYQSESDWVVQP